MRDLAQAVPALMRAHAGCRIGRSGACVESIRLTRAWSAAPPWKALPLFDPLCFCFVSAKAAAGTELLHDAPVGLKQNFIQGRRR